MFNEKEIKILKKLLDPALSDAEAEVCEEPLIRLLRKRGAKISEFDGSENNGSGNSNGATPLSRTDYGQCRFPWGSYCGEMLIDVPPDYLEEVADAIEHSGVEQSAENLKLVERIKKFLAQ